MVALDGVALKVSVGHGRSGYQVASTKYQVLQPHGFLGTTYLALEC